MKSNYSFKIRAAAFIAAVVFVISVFIGDLFRIQVIMRDEYASKKLSLSSVSNTVDAVRGEILDSNGTPLVYNVQSNTVYIDASYFPRSAQQEKRNEILLSLIKLFDENQVEYSHALPIELSEGGLVFAEKSESDKAYLFKADYLNLNSYATAQNCFDALCEYYSLGGMTADDALKVGGILFRMRRADFSTANPFTLAEDVPDNVVLILKEQSRFYEGIEIRTDVRREYYDGTIAPHIVGYYDYIDADEYKAVTEQYKEQLKDETLTDEQKEELRLRAYGMTDKIGKFGIESAMEEELRGTKGKQTTVTNSDGTKTTSITKEPVNGNNVILTIEADFQKEVQKILDARINDTRDLKNIAAAGSIVVMDVKTGAVLACATYPTFDLSYYKENQVELNTDPSAPLWNRALRSTYAPGSTVKPAMSIAALNEGIITPQTRIKCTINYTPFPQWKCVGLGGHGGKEITVEEAIKHSCNIFYYTVGSQLGINRISSYLSAFGLGQKTGVELTEATGVVASAENRINAGGTWYPGDTIQAAIGQSDSLFTPIQLASYVSALANNGKRYKAHFVKSIKSADYSQTIYEAEPVLLGEVEASDEAYAAVRRGMVAMANTYASIRGLDYSVAAKTGTAQAKKRVNGQIVSFTNGFVMSYAPADNPQIAVVAAIENVSSAGLPTYVRDVYEAYFNRNSVVTGSQQSNTVLR